MPLLFFKKLFSFSNSAFSRRRRRRSSIISNWDFSSSLFWHSSRYERTRLETVAPDMPYSATRLAIVRPSWMCARTTFRLIFESCAFLLCWHYNLSGRGVTNSLYHYSIKVLVLRCRVCQRWDSARSLCFPLWRLLGLSLSFCLLQDKRWEQEKRDLRLLGISEDASTVLPEYYHRRGKAASLQPFHSGGRNFRTAQAQPQLQTLPDWWKH